MTCGEFCERETENGFSWAVCQLWTALWRQSPGNCEYNMCHRSADLREKCQQKRQPCKTIALLKRSLPLWLLWSCVRCLWNNVWYYWCLHLQKAQRGFVIEVHMAPDSIQICLHISQERQEMCSKYTPWKPPCLQLMYHWSDKSISVWKRRYSPNTTAVLGNKSHYLLLHIVSNRTCPPCRPQAWSACQLVLIFHGLHNQ